MNNLSLCSQCNCMTKTIDNKCGKCENNKTSDTDNNVAIKLSTIEQDWDRLKIEDKIIGKVKRDRKIVKLYGLTYADIRKLKKQERTQLIDEIVGLVDACRWVSGTHFVINGKQEKMISKIELKTKLIELKIKSL